jgi:hypothetical protein
VTTDAACTWTAVSAADWIAVTAPTTGNGSVRNKVENRVHRPGTLVVAGQAVAIAEKR